MTPAIRTCERTDHTVICPERKAAEIMGTFWRAGDGTYIWVGAGRMGTVRCCPWCFRDLPDGPFPLPQGDGYEGEDGG
jgi:hypothetical protein